MVPLCLCICLCGGVCFGLFICLCCRYSPYFSQTEAKKFVSQMVAMLIKWNRYDLKGNDIAFSRVGAPLLGHPALRIQHNANKHARE